jgi:hypothetical protein
VDEGGEGEGVKAVRAAHLVDRVLLAWLRRRGMLRELGSTSRADPELNLKANHSADPPPSRVIGICSRPARTVAKISHP